MGNAAQYKKNAEEWREIPRRMRRAEERAKLERMADERQQLAETERKRK
ncbi:MAG TPA: hypothetical protein VFU97_18675 [Xanthobacteraceae bacterium]|jgi:uncharacterized membrane protein (DUF106 family)|nr:hypothetical protein [Xanthobacteraceae bacterium]